jgi:hypothetical protein
MDNHKHIQFPQDVNSELVDGIIAHAVSTVDYDYSDKQLGWILKSAYAFGDDLDAQNVAFLLAFAKFSGPELAPVSVSDDELLDAAKGIFDQCTAAALRTLGGLQ